MNITCILLGLAFLCAGAAFYRGKLHTRMESWKLMTAEERAGIRIEQLCRNIGSMIALSGCIFLAAGLWNPFRERAFVWCMLAWLLLAGLDVFLIEKTGRYKAD